MSDTPDLKPKLSPRGKRNKMFQSCHSKEHHRYSQGKLQIDVIISGQNKHRKSGD